MSIAAIRELKETFKANKSAFNPAIDAENNHRSGYQLRGRNGSVVSSSQIASKSLDTNKSALQERIVARMQELKLPNIDSKSDLLFS